MGKKNRDGRIPMSTKLLSWKMITINIKIKKRKIITTRVAPYDNFRRFRVP